MKTRVITDFKITENTIYFKIKPNHNQFDYEIVDNDKMLFEVSYDCKVNTLHWRYLPKFKLNNFSTSSSINLDNFQYSGSFECIFYPEGLKLPYNHRRPLEWEVTSIPNKKEAKLIWKNIKDKMSKPLYDRFIQAWDLQCKCGEWVSNPSMGYVKEAKPVKYNLFGPVYNLENSFSYYRKGGPFIFEKVPSDEWFEEAWWTEEEYEAVRSMYKLDLNRYSEPEKVLANWLKDWPDFEDLYRKEGKEINGNKMVTKHWYNAVKKGLIRCPICEDAYLMSKAIGYPPLRKKYRFYKIKEFFRKIFTK